MFLQTLICSPLPTGFKGKLESSGDKTELIEPNLNDFVPKPEPIEPILETLIYLLGLKNAKVKKKKKPTIFFLLI